MLIICLLIICSSIGIHSKLETACARSLSICCSKWLELFSKDVSIAELFPNIRTSLKLAFFVGELWIFFWKRVFFWKQVAAERPPFCWGALCWSYLGGERGKTLITCLIKREYYRPGSSKPPIPPRFFSSTKAPRVFCRTLGTCRTVEKSIEGKQFGSKLNGSDPISSSCKWSIPRLNGWRKTVFWVESIFGWNLNRSDLIWSLLWVSVCY